MNEPNLTGKTFGEYELQEMIGRGGMGTVYRAYQPSLKRDVAVKVLSFEFASRSSYIRRFTREAQMVATLQHPHILPIQYYGVQDGTSYMVMPLLTGGTLARHLSRRIRENKPLPSLDSIATLLRQIAGALDYAHSQGVIHRDIKPNNIMFDNQGNAYLMDFGIAKFTSGESDMTSTGLVVGAPQYIAPEQWRGDELSPAADLYSLGATVYAMLTGRAPFDAETPHAMMHKHLYEIAPSPQNFREDVPNAIIDVVTKAMAKQPEDRYSSADAFASAFEKALRIGAPHQLDDDLPKSNRIPVVWGLGIAAALLFVMLTVLLLSRDTSDQAVVQPTVTETDLAEIVAVADVPSDTPVPLPSATSVVVAIPTITPFDPTEIPSPTALPPTEMPSQVPSLIPSNTPIPLPSATSVIVIIPTTTPFDPTGIPSTTPTLPPTETATLTVTSSATSTSTATESPTSTNTALPTNTPLPTVTPIIAFGDILFQDNFEGADLTGWKYDPSTAWIIDDGSSRVLSLVGNGWSSIVPHGGSNWVNYSVDMRVKILKSVPSGRSSDFNLSVRNHANGNYLGWMSAATDYATLGRNLNGDYRNISAVYQLPLSTDVWYNLRIDADGSQIRLFVNGTLMAFATDSNPINGTMSIMASPGAEFYVDDVRVISLDRSSTALASARRGIAMENLNIRSGPGRSFQTVSGLKPGDQVFIIAQNPEWVYIRKDDNSGIQGWVAAEFIRLF